MIDATPSWPLLAFIGASLVLAVTPGPGVLYVVTRTLVQGRRAGLASIAGVALGNLCNALGASLGLAALFAVSALAFTVVKVVGACYLFHLALQALRGAVAASGVSIEPQRLRRLAGDGFAVALLNPKTALFFAAFLPPFIDPAGSAMLQAAAYASGFVAIAALTDTAYVLGAGRLAPWLRSSGRGRRAGAWLASATYFALGVFALLGHSRPGRPA